MSLFFKMPPQLPFLLSGSPHPIPKENSLKSKKQKQKQNKNGDSELPTAVSEEAFCSLGLSEGDGDGVGGDIGHCHFTWGERRCPGRWPLSQVCICLLFGGLLSRLPLAGRLEDIWGR